LLHDFKRPGDDALLSVNGVTDANDVRAAVCLQLIANIGRQHVDFGQFLSVAEVNNQAINCGAGLS